MKKTDDSDTRSIENKMYGDPPKHSPRKGPFPDLPDHVRFDLDPAEQSALIESVKRWQESEAYRQLKEEADAVKGGEDGRPEDH